MNLEEMKALEDGWYAKGTPAPSEACLDTLRAIHMAPMTSGGVQLELHAGNFEMELVIRQDGRVTEALVEWSEDHG